MRTKELLAFMTERHSIYLRRAAGEPKPWTKDPILQKFKFTNVYRELDRVTIWIKECIRAPYAEHPHLWFMLAIARRLNWPYTLAELISEKAWPTKTTWDPQRMLDALDARMARGMKVYGNAYMITAQTGAEHKGETKSRSTAYANLLPLWEARKEIEPCLHDTLADAYETLLGKGFAWGPFMTAQVVCDLAYTRYLRDAKDWMTWAHSGPGSQRGMNRLLGLPAKSRSEDRGFHLSTQDEARWLATLHEIQVAVNAKWKWEPLRAQDLQSCLCEWDKHERVRLGEGRPKELYPGDR